MKKNERWREIRLSLKRLRKRELRLRKSRIYNPVFAGKRGYGITYAELTKILEKWKCPYFEFYKKSGFIKKELDYGTSVDIPSSFLLTDDYHDVVDILGDFTSKIYSFQGVEIAIYFKDCADTDLPALFMLKIIYTEYVRFARRLAKTEPGTQSYFNTIKFHPSETETVNHKLVVTGLRPQAEYKKAKMVPIMSTPLIIGVKSKKAYAENKKGHTASSIVTFINSCIKRHEHELSAHGVNKFEGIITEVLNNAEDHSDFDDWFCYASLFETTDKQDENFTGEINLMIFNFGYSISDGFEMTKSQNHEMYDEMEQFYEQVAGNLTNKLTSGFSKENFLTLYALSQGFSRLKFEEESRGTGTIKFLNSFIGLGDYADEIAHFEPKLHIVSGNTMLICDKNHKPYQEQDGVFYLSLNPENDMTKLPSKENLLNLKQNFPGTLITVKIYLNKNHLKAKLNENGN